MKGYSKLLKKLPIKDWKAIVQFSEIIKNYLKMKRIKTIKNEKRRTN